jgi:hypothetical protein
VPVALLAEVPFDVIAQPQGRRHTLGLLLVIAPIRSHLGCINIIATPRFQLSLAALPGAGVLSSLALQCFILFA